MSDIPVNRLGFYVSAYMKEGNRTYAATDRHALMALLTRLAEREGWPPPETWPQRDSIPTHPCVQIGHPTHIYGATGVLP